MTRSQAANEARERDLLDRLPLEAEHVPNSEDARFDARLLAPLRTTPPIAVVERIAIEPGTELELKTCQRWISDRGSWNGRRRGTFQLSEHAQTYLVDADGVNLFVLLEGEEILAARAVPARELPPLTYTNGGRDVSSGRAHVSWPDVIPREAV